MKKGFIVLLLFLFLGHEYAQEGNLIAPGPTFTFGQNILKQGTMVGIEQLNYFETAAGSFLDNVHELVAALTDNSSLTIFLPVILRDRERGLKTESGLGSITLQGEYAFINRQEDHFYHLMTFVSAIAFPSSTTIDIPTIRSVPAHAFFFGISSSMLGNGWYWYNGIGTLIHTKKRERKLRNRFIFDIGVGKIVQKSANHYFALLIEINEIYLGSPGAPNAVEINRKPVNVILIGPTLRFANRRNVVQIGFQYPFTQKNVTDFERITFRASFAFAWRF